MFCYELHQLLLGVRLAWDGDRFLHKRLIEIHLVHLQSQLLGHLKQRTHSKLLRSTDVCLFICLFFVTYRFLKGGKELNVGLELLCSFFERLIV